MSSNRYRPYQNKYRKSAYSKHSKTLTTSANSAYNGQLYAKKAAPSASYYQSPDPSNDVSSENEQSSSTPYYSQKAVISQVRETSKATISVRNARKYPRRQKPKPKSKATSHQKKSFEKEQQKQPQPQPTSNESKEPTVKKGVFWADDENGPQPHQPQQQQQQQPPQQQQKQKKKHWSNKWNNKWVPDDEWVAPKNSKAAVEARRRYAMEQAAKASEQAAKALLESPLMTNNQQLSSPPQQRKSPPRKKLTRMERVSKIRQQMEFYFSPKNMNKDDYLRSLMDGKGWIKLDALIKFNRMKKLKADTGMVIEAAMRSKWIEIKPFNGMQRVRVKNWRDYVRVERKLKLKKKQKELDAAELNAETILQIVALIKKKEHKNRILNELMRIKLDEDSEKVKEKYVDTMSNNQAMEVQYQQRKQSNRNRNRARKYEQFAQYQQQQQYEEEVDESENEEEEEENVQYEVYEETDDDDDEDVVEEYARYEREAPTGHDMVGQGDENDDDDRFEVEEDEEEEVYEDGVEYFKQRIDPPVLNEIFGDTQSHQQHLAFHEETRKSYSDTRKPISQRISTKQDSLLIILWQMYGHRKGDMIGEIDYGFAKHEVSDPLVTKWAKKQFARYNYGHFGVDWDPKIEQIKKIEQKVQTLQNELQMIQTAMKQGNNA